MPEGDTIHRVVGRLRPILEGRPVEAIEVARHVGELPCAGEIIEAVDARGKHVMITFSGGLVLRCHLRMTGSWHAYREGERWHRARSRARVLIRVPGWVAVCFDAPDVSVSHDAAEEIAHLGPDLCRSDADVEAAVARFDRFLPAEVPIATALLDQRVAAGIGNVYKAEVLHLEGVDPRRGLGTIDIDLRRRLLRLASELLRANLGPGSRRTVPEGLAVYGREGEQCRRCGGVIERFHQGGATPRVTYWCPGCQD